MARVARTLASGIGFTEGPVVAADGTVYVTSIDHGAVYRLEEDGWVIVWGDLGGGANGAAIDRDGTLYVAQNGGRWARNGPRWRPDSVGGLQRITPAGCVEWVTREPIAPNDLCFGPDGLLYLTDPTRAPGAADGRLWRVDPSDGSTELLRSVSWFPNGIAFGPDDALYVASTHASQIIRIEPDGGEQVIVRMEHGKPDGFAFDAAGDLVIAALMEDGTPGQIQTWSTAGEQLDEFLPSDSSVITNVAFTARGDLLITDSQAGSVLLVEGWGAGLPLHPFR